MKSVIEKNGSYHIQLTPLEKGFHLRLKELWQYRDLVRLMTGKTFAVTYQQTFLGPLWIIHNPVISSLIY
ncbi:MAG: ABC transporter permease, partial [Oscillospiraceae bacterium]|nr:ABC transporter permease [Oscillospiraceae bacterium]